MNTSAETLIDDFADRIRSIANKVRERLDLKQRFSVEDHGSFLLVRFAFWPSIRIPGEWVMEHPAVAERWIEERLEAALRPR